MNRWSMLLAFLPSTAFAYNYLWDFSGAVDRFEMKLDNGAYVSVGLPPLASGTWTLPGDPTLTGSHSAVVRACSAGVCTPDSNILSFTVAPAPKPAAPTNPRLVAAITPPPPTLTESPTGTKASAPGVGSIIDAKLVIWTFGPKDPLVEGGMEYTILHNGTREGGAAIYLCYFNHLVYAWSTGLWFQQTALNGFQLSPIVPVGC